MNIPINSKNADKITKVLIKAQGLSRVRVIDYGMLDGIVQQLPNLINPEIIKKKYKVRFHYHENNTPFSYTWAVMTTHIVLEKDPEESEWRLVECKRIDTVPGKSGDRYFIQRQEKDVRIQNLKGRPLILKPL